MSPERELFLTIAPRVSPNRPGGERVPKPVWVHLVRPAFSATRYRITLRAWVRRGSPFDDWNKAPGSAPR